MTSTNKHLAATALALAFALGIWLSAAGSYANEWDHNEGVYFNSARLVARGHELFAEVFSSQPPIFLSSLAAAFVLFGDTPDSGRVFMAVVAMVGLGAIAYLGWHLLTPAAAPWCVVAAATSYLYARGGHYAEADLPAAALALLAMAIALAANRKERLLLAALSGFAFAAAVMTKVLVVPWLPALALLFLPAAAGRSGGIFKAVVATGAACAAGFFLGLGAIFAAFGPDEVWKQAFLFHFEKRGSTGVVAPWTANLSIMVQYLGRDVGLGLLALVGAAVLASKRSFGLVWLLALGGGAFVFGLYHTPLVANHLVPMAVAIAISAGAGCAAVLAFTSKRLPGALAVLCVLMLSQVSVDSAVPGLPLRGQTVLTLNPLRNHLKFLHVAYRDEDLAIMEYLRANTEPDELVVSDGHKAVFWAGRASPPFLCDVSRERIESGWLTDEDIIRHTEGVKVVVIQSTQLDRFPKFKEWLAANYRLEQQVSPTARIYRRVAD